MLIKRSFFILLIVVSLVNIALSKTVPSILGSFSSPRASADIQLEKQAKFIPNIKKSAIPFYEFKYKHPKNYINPQEEVYRSIVYSKNQDKINQNNQKLDRKYNMALNCFADLTPLEFSQTFTNLFKSNPKVKSYTQKILEQQNSLNPTNTFPINQAYFISKNPQDFRAVRDHVIKHTNDKKTNVVNENSQFSVVEEVFASVNPNTKTRQTKKQQLKNSFDKHPGLKYKTYGTFSGFNIQYANPTVKSQDFYGSLQRQLDNILENTANAIPLKLTSDIGLSGTSLTSAMTSGSGNFTTEVIDWTVHAGKVRYQGVCGACYTFATSDAVASLYAIYKFGFFVALSTQQVVDCSSNGLTYSCNGGFLEGSYAYMQIKGIQTDVNYPYTSAISGMSGTCKKQGGSFKVTSFRNIEQGNCRALVNQLNYGPVSIGIAGYRLQFYSGGIFNDCNSYVDHAVVLIAYKAGVGWKIKNSWGPEWGMGGFAWIADGNNCGICNMAVSARI